MKKFTSTIVPIIVAFVLVSSLLSIHGNVFAQETQNQTSNTMASPNGNTTSTSNQTAMKETSHGTVTRDSATILLEGEHLPANSFIHLYDTTPYQLVNGHLAAKLPCDDNNKSQVEILTGQAPALKPVEPDFVAPLSEPGKLCLYHVDLNSKPTNILTDIDIKNNSTKGITFPPTSTVVIGVNEIAPLPAGHHD